MPKQQQQPQEAATFKFYTALNPETGQPKGLFRWVEGEGMDTLMERYDPEQQAWVDHPGLLAATGIGGDNPYEQITDDQAQALFDKFSHGDEDLPDQNNDGSGNNIELDIASDDPSGYESLPEVDGKNAKKVKPGAIDGFIKRQEQEKDIGDRRALIGKDKSGSDVAFWEDMLPPQIEKEMLDFIRKHQGDFDVSKKKLNKNTSTPRVEVNLLDNKRGQAVKSADVHVRGHWRWTRKGKVWGREYYREGQKRSLRKTSKDTWAIPDNTDGLRPMGSFMFDGGSYTAYYDAAATKFYLWHDDSKTFVAQADGFNTNYGESINDAEIVNAFHRTMLDERDREELRLSVNQRALPGMSTNFTRPIPTMATTVNGDTITGMIKPTGRKSEDGEDKVLINIFMWNDKGEEIPTELVSIKKEDFEKLTTHPDVARNFLLNAYGSAVFEANEADLSPEELASNIIEYGQFLEADNAGRLVRETGTDMDVLLPYMPVMEGSMNVKAGLDSITNFSPTDLARLLKSLTKMPFGINDGIKLKVSKITGDNNGIRVFLSAKNSRFGDYNVSFSISDDETYIGLIDLRGIGTGTNHGAGAEILQTIEILGTPSGLTTLEANINVGGYAWAIMGYDFRDIRTKEMFVESFLDGVEEEYGKDTIDNDPLLSRMKKAINGSFDVGIYNFHSWDLAQWVAPDGYHWGKQFMLGTEWDAVKDVYSDEIGVEYYKKRLGEKSGRHIEWIE